MLAITMTAYRRPEYTKQVLEALQNCHGIDKFVFFPQVEPGHEDVIEQFSSWKACEIQPVVNKQVLGLNKNTRTVLERAYNKKASIIVHVEDDIVFSTDALSFFVWAVENVVSRSRIIMSACGYNRTDAPLDKYYSVYVRNIFNCWGWATNREKLAWMFSKWSYTHPTKFTRVFRARYSKELYECYPLLSRVQNIGCELSTNNHTPEWYKEAHYTPYVAVNVPVKPFRLEVKVAF